jgi:hypothetical protein
MVYQIFVIWGVFCLTATPILYKRGPIPVILFFTDHLRRSGHLP